MVCGGCDHVLATKQAAGSGHPKSNDERECHPNKSDCGEKPHLHAKSRLGSALLSSRSCEHQVCQKLTSKSWALPFARENRPHHVNCAKNCAHKAVRIRFVLTGTAGVPPALSVANNPLTTQRDNSSHSTVAMSRPVAMQWVPVHWCVVLSGVALTRGLFATLSAGGTPAVPVRILVPVGIKGKLSLD